MNHIELDENNTLYIDYKPAKGRPTFVFINALTGNTDHWENSVAPACRNAGFGTLSYNMRGQINTALADDVEPDCDLIVADLVRLLDETKPEQPILCGLSIGGLYAAKAILAGANAKAVVLLNTLREIGPRLAWLNQGMVHVLNTGGFPLLLDMYLPLLTSQDFHQGMRPNHLKGELRKARLTRVEYFRFARSRFFRQRSCRENRCSNSQLATSAMAGRRPPVTTGSTG